MHAKVPAHAQVRFIAQAAGTSMQRISPPRWVSVRAQMYLSGLQAAQSFTVRHDDAFTQCPDQHVPEIEGTSPAGHGGGIAAHATAVESHSLASAQVP